MLVRWKPRFGLASRPEEFDRYFDEMFNWWRADERVERSWMPSVDVVEKNGDYQVQAELPGMKKEDIEVLFDNGELVIRGERKWQDEERKENYHRVERRYGKFERRFLLPENVNEQELKAEYKDGVLNVVIPKVQAPKPKQIPVEVK
jgi:HSP20 family protein